MSKVDDARMIVTLSEELATLRRWEAKVRRGDDLSTYHAAQAVGMDGCKCIDMQELSKSFQAAALGLLSDRITLAASKLATLGVSRDEIG